MSRRVRAQPVLVEGEKSCIGTCICVLYPISWTLYFVFWICIFSHVEEGKSSTSFGRGGEKLRRRHAKMPWSYIANICIIIILAHTLHFTYLHHHHSCHLGKALKVPSKCFPPKKQNRQKNVWFIQHHHNHCFVLTSSSPSQTFSKWWGKTFPSNVL